MSSIFIVVNIFIPFFNKIKTIDNWLSYFFITKNVTHLNPRAIQATYTDVRQLIVYVKEAHGGVFRRVALSGLIDSADRPHKQTQQTQTTRVVR